MAAFDAELHIRYAAGTQPGEVTIVSEEALDLAEAARDAAQSARDQAVASAADAATSAGTFTAPADSVIAGMIDDPASDVRASLATVPPPGNLFSQGRVDALGQVERDLSRTGSAVRWADAAGFVERWASTAAWQVTAGNLQVSGGKLFRGTSATFPGAVKAVADIGTTGLARFRGSFVLPAAGTGVGLIFGGLWTGVTNVAISASPTQAFGIGFRETNVPIQWDGGTATNLGAAVAAGTYYWTIIASETGFTYTLETSAGVVLYTVRKDIGVRTAITGVIVYNSDTRQLTGIGVSACAARADFVTAAERSGIEGTAATTQYASADGQDIRVHLPASWDSRKPVPLVLYSHARSGDEDDPWTGADPGGPLEVTNALTAAGFAVIANAQHGNNWGNQDAVDDLYESYKYFRDRYPLGPVLILAQSMGGLAALNTIVQKRTPGIRGFCGIFTAANLAANYALGTYAADIRTAYGIAADGSDYAAKTAGMDPALQDGDAFQGVPMRFYHSPADVTVTKADNSDVIAALALPYTTEAEVVATTGTHGDASNFQGSDVVDFFNRCITAV